MNKYIVENSYKASQGIACAVLVCLGVGLLLQTIGNIVDALWLQKIGFAAKTLFIPALGLSIAMIFRANSTIVLCAGAAALIGGGSVLVSDQGLLSIKGGEPIGAIIACLATIWFGKRVSGKTNFDMILTPIIALFIGGIVGLFSSFIITPLLSIVSESVRNMITYSPIISTAFISLLFAFLILSPASSAALAIAFSLDPIASGAALIGCSVQFTAFAFLGIKENTWGAFLCQLICTPKLQTPNIIKKPRIMLVPLFLSTILAPIGVLCFGINSANEVAGLGLCAFVAPLYMLSHQGMEMFLQFLFISVILPAVICIVIKPFILKFGLLQDDDLKINLN